MAKKCNVPGCDQEAGQAGLCKFHHQMYFQKQSQPVQQQEKTGLRGILKRKEPMQEAIIRQQEADQIKAAVMKEDDTWQKNYGKQPEPEPEPEPEVQQVYDEAMQIPLLNGTIVSIERKYDAIQQMQFMEIRLQLFGENNFPYGNTLHLGDVKMLQDDRK